MRIQIDVAVDFFYGGRDSYLVRRAECEFRVQRCQDKLSTNKSDNCCAICSNKYILRVLASS